ncbi:hypothetical protein GF337_05895, partial [candidate division KSB1 bacterium]|nr:hypothetical protein [candidate division KSB1 bacterium]
PVNTNITGDPHDFQIIYTPELEWHSYDSIHVVCKALDLDGNEGTVSYWFKTEDITPPEITPIYPQSGDTNVSRFTDIQLFVSDNETGIDYDNCVLMINDIETNFDVINDTIICQPNPFGYNQTVKIDFHAADISGNTSDSSYNFITEPDTFEPQIIPIYPIENQTMVPPDTEIIVAFLDEETGIDPSTIVFDATGEGTYNFDNDTLSYTPATPFEYGDTVDVSVSVKDFAENAASKAYSFTIIPDTIEPKITVIRPKAFEKNVPLDTDLLINVVDSQSGVKPASIVLEIDNAQVPHSYQDGDIHYTPLQPFQWGDTVWVHLTVEDMAGNPADTTYSFYTESDTINPVITPVYPQDGDTRVSPKPNIFVALQDEETGIDSSTIAFRVNSEDIQTYSFKNDTLKYWQSTPLSYESTVEVFVSVRDFAGNDTSKTYSFEIMPEPPDTIPPEITIIQPLPDETDVSVKPTIMLSAHDYMSGLDVSSAEMTINGDTASLTISDDSLFTYTPDSVFAFDSYVSVKFEIADMAGNLDSVEYSFKTISKEYDKTPPIIHIVRPDSNATGVSVDTDIMLTAIDPESGIDTSSIELRIDDIIVTHDFEKDSVISYQPSSPFSCDTTVYVKLNVKNSAGLKSEVFYSFMTGCTDTIPPVVEVLWPDPFSTIVPMDTSVAIRVADKGVGVDILSATMLIDSLEVELNVQGDTLIYHPIKPFEMGDSIHVCFSVKDYAENTADTCYWFKTIEDTFPPEIFAIVPEAFQTECSVTTPVILTTIDEHSGVDFSTAELKISDKPKTFTVDNDTVRFATPIPFPFETKIDVYFAIADSNGNRADTTYWFETGSFIDYDLKPPIVFDHQPAIYGCSDSLITSIQFKLWDEKSGVNIDSITVKTRVNDLSQQDLNFTTQMIADSVFVVCEEQRFNYNDTVWVEIYAVDNEGNHTDTNQTDSTVYYYFTVPFDVTPPRVNAIEPEQLESLDDTLFVEIEDDISGVNTDSLEFYLWTLQNPEHQNITHAIRVNLDGKMVFIEYNPDQPYCYNDSLSLKLILVDNVGNRDTLTFENEIATPEVLSDLYFLNLANSAGEEAIEVESYVMIKALISNKYIDCDMPFEIKFYLDHSENPFYQVEVPGLDAGELYETETKVQLMQEGEHRVVVKIDPDPMPDGKIKEESEFNNVMETVIQVEGAELTVKSNPFTPNDDGFNDYADFNFEQFVLEEPSLKIFDIHGKLIREFNERDQQGKRFVWNGRDRHGKGLMPGIYFYVLLNKSNPITRGCVVIIK